MSIMYFPLKGPKPYLYKCDVPLDRRKWPAKATESFLVGWAYEVPTTTAAGKAAMAFGV